MPLTPEDVSNKRFTPVRLREGYDMGEVDQFLDEVEAEFERMLKENDDLRAKLAAQTDGAAPSTVTAAAPKAPEKAEKTAEKAPEKAEEKAEEKAPEKAPEKPAPVVATPREEIKVVTAAEASSAATRLLELATRNADEVVAEAREEAEQIVGTARTEAEQLESETKSRTDQLEQEARSRAQNLDSETEAKRVELLGEMEQERTRLDGEIENLRSFEREYRSRLKSYFSEQLRALEGDGPGGDLPGEVADGTADLTQTDAPAPPPADAPDGRSDEPPDGPEAAEGGGDQPQG